MRFLGDVNELPVPAEGGATGGATVVGYVRPHEVDVSRSPGSSGAQQGVRAKVKRVQPAGASVRIELDLDAGDAVIAELDERRFEELALRNGDAVYVSPRRVRVFDATA
jgi:sulfate transport system ATP-binding protein